MKRFLLIALLCVGFTGYGQSPELFRHKSKKFDMLEFKISKEYFWLEVNDQDTTSIKNLASDEELKFFGRGTALLRAQMNRNEGFDNRANALRAKFANKFRKIRPVLIDADSSVVIARDRIILKFNDENHDVSKLFKGRTAIFRPDEFVPNQYLVTISSLKNFDIFKVCERLEKRKEVDFAEPDYTMFAEPQTNDQHYDSQWALENDGSEGTLDADIDVEGAWQYTIGQNIKIAIIDVGIDLNHDDLDGNLGTGYDATGTGANGLATGAHASNAHGTQIAGVIGAEANNTIGVAGIAYDAELLSVKMGYVNTMGVVQTNASWIANCINWARNNGADVINISQKFTSGSSAVNNALTDAATIGRGGLGIILVGAAGNDGASSIVYPARRDDVISVGGSNYCDERKTLTSCDVHPFFPISWESNYGNDLDLVAPGAEIYTTDRTGLIGVSQGDYYGRFWGTSAAAPHVSGVAALVLAANPNLTRSEVKEYILRNVDKVSGYTFSPSLSKPYGTWNLEMGYGRLNAHLAVEEARFDAIELLGNDYACLGPATYAYNLSNLPSGITAQSWSVSSNLTIQNTSTTGVVVRAISSGTAWIEATFTGGLKRKFNLWAGTPSSPSFLLGPNSVVSGGFVYYYGSSANGAESYEWRLPYPFDVVGIFNIFGANWQMQNTTTYNSLYAFTGTSGTDGYVQLMGKNPCGLGPAKSIYVEHDPNGGGQIPRVNPEHDIIVLYPNPSNDIVKIDVKKNNNGIEQNIAFEEITISNMDMTYQKTFKPKPSERSFEINVANLRKGVYTVRIKVKTGVVIKKLYID